MDRKLAGRGHDLQAMSLKDNMSEEILYRFEDQSIAGARDPLTKRNLRQLPVVDQDLGVIGMVSLSELENASPAPGRPRSKKV